MPDGTQQVDTTQATGDQTTTQQTQTPATVVTGDTAKTQTTQTTEAKWPDTWRNMISADEKHAKTLERFSSPKALWDSYSSLRQRFDSGEVRTKLAKDAKPEEIAAWRKENGIPEAPEKYDLTMPDGLVIGDADKPIVSEFTKIAHSQNMHPDQVKQTVGWYFKERERQLQERHEKDEDARIETEDALRSEWGNEYRGNLNQITAMLDAAPEGLKEQLMSARLADGKAMFNDAAALRWLVDIARQLNPAITVIPNAGANQAGAIDDEIARLKGLMQNPNSEYWKGPTAQKNQDTYRKLVESRDRLKKRAA